VQSDAEQVRDWIKEANQLFPAELKPKVFLKNPGHCCECEEHEETLQSKDRESIGVNEIGSQAWDPMCYISIAGFKYFLPAMVRLALADRGKTGYIESFLFHLNWDEPGNERVESFTPEQNKFVRDFLMYLIDLYAPQFSEWVNLEESFEGALRVWG
jgi:hypothetical protein